MTTSAVKDQPIEVWLAPDWGAMVRFHDRDESWARPLGLGRVIDIRPAINRAAARMQQHVELMMMYGVQYK